MANDSRTFRSILVPLDGSSFAEQALPLAARIADRTGAKLRLALVHELAPAPVDPLAAKMYTRLELGIRKSERAYLRRMQATLRDAGTRLSSAVTMTGTPASALSRYVQELGMDLVVMSTHGRGGVRRAWLGSVADQLIRSLNVPVLLVRPRGDSQPATSGAVPTQILVPLDGSPLAEEALPVAVALARALGLEISLLQVVHPVLISSDPIFPVPAAYDEDLTATCRDQAQDYIEDLSQRLRDQGLRATGTAVIGWYAADMIHQLGQPDNVAMIVIATHGRGGVRRLALGSVADKVVRGADIPVLVYRPAERRTRKSPLSRKASRSRSRAKAGR